MDFELKLIDPRYGKEWDLPAYETVGAAAIDIRAAVQSRVTLTPNSVTMIGAGIAIHIKHPGYAGILIPRSGAGSKGLILGNSAGLFDSDYQGEIKVCAWNRSNSIYAIEPGDRIAQLIFVPIVKARLKAVKQFSGETQRGAGGFGSTGVK